MMITMALLSTLMINIIFLMMNHPLAITLTIIIQTLMTCFISGSISYTFWFSYILFMIFLGGMLVLFIYMTSLASNELFLLPTKTILYSSMILFIIMLSTLMMNHLLTPIMNKFDTMNSTSMMMESMNLNQLYNYPNFMLTISTITYLLITLIIISKIINIQKGPLRHSY